MSTLTVPIVGYTATVPSFQWDYVGGAVYGERNVAATDDGVFYREKTGVVQQRRQIRFVNADAVIETLRRVSMLVGRRALPVIFTPDEVNAPGVSYIVDWPARVEFKQTLDGRREFTVDLLEQSTGA